MRGLIWGQAGCGKIQVWRGERRESEPPGGEQRAAATSQTASRIKRWQPGVLLGNKLPTAGNRCPIAPALQEAARANVNNQGINI